MIDDNIYYFKMFILKSNLYLATNLWSNNRLLPTIVNITNPLKIYPSGDNLYSSCQWYIFSLFFNKWIQKKNII